MRISDWSSDVCSSDLDGAPLAAIPPDSRDVGPLRASSMQCVCPYVAASWLTRSVKPSIWREAMSALVYKLTVVHHRLDDQIRQELKRRFPDGIRQIGRASCRERVCQYV